MKITTLGVDLAKDVFQLHGVDERGRVVLKRQIRRESDFAEQSPRLQWIR